MPTKDNPVPPAPPSPRKTAWDEAWKEGRVKDGVLVPKEAK